MRAREITLLVVSILGLVAFPLVAFMLLLNVMGPGGAETSRGIAVFALIVCAAVLAWEVVEVRLRTVARAHRAMPVTALVLTALTAIGYVLVRIALR